MDVSSKVDENSNHKNEIPEGHPIGTTVEAYWRNSSWRGAIIIERGTFFFLKSHDDDVDVFFILQHFKSINRMVQSK